MNIESVRRFCLSLPHSTEQVQWGEHLVFKVGGKIYTILALEPAKHLMSFKVDPETFAELTENEGIVQAPYCAKGQWVALEPVHPLTLTELQRLLRHSYDLVFAKLTKKLQAELSGKSKTRPRAKKASGKHA